MEDESKRPPWWFAFAVVGGIIAVVALIGLIVSAFL
jgi:hypothetical protein